MGTQGNNNNEKLSWDFESTADKVIVSSTTGVSDIVLQSINLRVPNFEYSVAWDNSARVPTKNAVYDKIESLNQSLTAHIESIRENGAGGSTGSFTTNDGKTITVTNGIITSIT